MKLKYINQIRANLTSNKKTANILDGTFKSIYKGKSMNFENLREYVIDDDIKDIDWKASSRSGTLLVKQFIAEKKHNIMLVMDTGLKMGAETKKGEEKRELAIFTAGTVGLLTIKNGDYLGMMYLCGEEMIYKPLQYDLYHLEQYLTEYEKDAFVPTEGGISKTLQYLIRNIKKRMIIFIVTDISGLEQLDDRTLKEITIYHDLLVFVIEDSSLHEQDVFDVDNKDYLPAFLSNDKKLAEMDTKLKKSLYIKGKKRIQKYKGNVILLDTKKNLHLKVMELLERHKYANNR